MDVLDTIEEIRIRAHRDETFCKKLLESQHAKEPYKRFCEIVRECGYELYEMDLIEAGEVFHAAMKRSTNGGGENSPKLAYQDDFYEMLMKELDMQ